MDEEKALLLISKANTLIRVWQILNECQTPKVCLEAVKKDGRSLNYIDQCNQTVDICLVALDQDNDSFHGVKIIPNPDYETTYAELILLREKNKIFKLI